jgi:hypothetical protein
MMPETVIKLRRSVFGMREARSQGGYCAACGIGWSMDSTLAATPRPTAVFSRFRCKIKNVWPSWRLSGVAQPGHVRARGVAAAYDPLPLAR